MFVNKIKKKESGILLYGITPPKAQTEPEKVAEIAQLFGKVQPLPYPLKYRLPPCPISLSLVKAQENNN